jgi:hypothetical protein
MELLSKVLAFVLRTQQFAESMDLIHHFTVTDECSLFDYAFASVRNALCSLLHQDVQRVNEASACHAAVVIHSDLIRTTRLRNIADILPTKVEPNI